MRRILLLVVFFSHLSSFPAGAEIGLRREQARPRTVGADWRVAWEPAEPVNGSSCSLRVTMDEPLESLRGRWLGRDLFFDFDARSRTWHAIAGVALDVAAGDHQLALEGVTATGARLSQQQTIRIGHRAYPEIALRVSRRYTQPSAGTLRRIKREQALKSSIFARVTSRRLWRGPFAAPLGGVVTDGFGTARTFNGEVQSVHQGVDYRAAPGTPVAAMNAGRVVLAQNLYFEGNCVVIDHGQGLLTLYLHLSRLRVSEGERVEPGQVIGLSGATGRVTAPHLHAAVRWQGIYLDPETLIALALPEAAE